MLVDFYINTQQQASISANLEQLDNKSKIRDLLTLLIIVSSDFALDPEIDFNEFQTMLDTAKQKGKQSLHILIDEEEIELDFQ